MRRSFAELLIVPLAVLGIIVGVWDLFGWVVGAILIVVIAMIANEKRLNQQDREIERKRRAYLAEREWLSGDRRKARMK